MWLFESPELMRAFQKNWESFHGGCITSPWHSFLSRPSSIFEPVTPAVRFVCLNVKYALICTASYLNIICQIAKSGLDSGVAANRHSASPLKDDQNIFRLVGSNSALIWCLSRTDQIKSEKAVTSQAALPMKLSKEFERTTTSTVSSGDSCLAS